MSCDFIFVHGIGVREAAYASTYKIIERQLKQKDASARLHRCYWGGECGSKLNANGASVPQFEATRSYSRELDNDEFTLELWRLLYQDPLFELQFLAQQSQQLSFVPGKTPPGQELKTMVMAMSLSEDLIVGLAEIGIRPKWFDEARQTILAEPDFDNAMGKLNDEGLVGDYRKALARALFAQMVVLVKDENGSMAISCTSKQREQITTWMIDALGGSDRGIGLLFEALGGVLKRLGTNTVRDRRGKIFNSINVFPGDVILYQARGQEIRNFIRKTIAGKQGPVVLLAHSLGGVASVDLLLEEDPPKVDLLVTAGSQSPLFYEWNALVNKAYRAGASLPEGYPQWLNFYDEDDFLSYIGAEIFPGKVEDILIDSGQPFPESHGAYWNNLDVWDALFDRLPSS